MIHSLTAWKTLSKLLSTAGMSADGSACASLIGIAPEVTTHETVKHLFEWASVSYLSVIDGEAA